MKLNSAFITRSNSAARSNAVYVPGVIGNATGRNESGGLNNVVLTRPVRTLLGAYTLPNILGMVADNSTHCEMPSQSLDERLTEKSVQLAELGVRYLELILRSFVASIFCFLFYKCALADAHRKKKMQSRQKFLVHCSTTALLENTLISCAKNR